MSLIPSTCLRFYDFCVSFFYDVFSLTDNRLIYHKKVNPDFKKKFMSNEHAIMHLHHFRLNNVKLKSYSRK